MTILVIGAGGEPSFLKRLFQGLLDSGLTLWTGTHKVFDRSDNGYPLKPICYAPPWNGPKAWRIVRIVLMTLIGIIRSASDVKRIFGYALKQNGFTRKLNILYLNLPYAGVRPSVIYFPWILHSQEYAPLLNGNIPYVVSCRGQQVNVFPFIPSTGQKTINALKTAFKNATLVHCVSEDILETASEFGLVSSKVRVIRPSVDVKKFVPNLDLDRVNQIRIVTTGVLIWRKGIEQLILAVKHIADNGIDFRLDVLGEGNERERLCYAIKDHKLEDRVHLHGDVSTEFVIEYLQKSDIFLFTSLSEGLPNAVLEGMACGLPIVTTECGGVCEAVRDGIDGFVVPVRDSQALGAALLKLSTDSDLRARMGKSGRERIEDKFRLDTQISEMSSLFMKAASMGPSKSDSITGIEKPMTISVPKRRGCFILSVSPLHWKSGIEFALEAVKIASERGAVCEYHIVGQGEHLISVAFARHQLSLSDCVYIEDEVTDDVVATWLSKANILLYSDVAPRQNILIIEAQKLGIPVICTDVPGLCDHIENCVDGYIVPRRDKEAMAARLYDLVVDEHLRQSIGAAGRYRRTQK